MPYALHMFKAIRIAEDAIVTCILRPAGLSRPDGERSAGHTGHQPGIDDSASALEAQQCWVHHAVRIAHVQCHTHCRTCNFKNTIAYNFKDTPSKVCREIQAKTEDKTQHKVFNVWYARHASLCKHMQFSAMQWNSRRFNAAHAVIQTTNYNAQQAEFNSIQAQYLSNKYILENNFQFPSMHWT